MSLIRTLRCVVLFAAVAPSVLGSPAGAATDPPPAISIPTLPVSEIKPGMTGTGYSVFSGTKRDTFAVSIVGVLRRYKPGSDLILARASNEFLEKTGIIAGMSGSPVYVDGKLIGAVAYAWPFLKEPLAGITPIGEMLSVLPGKEGPPPSAEDRFGSLGAPPAPSDDPGGARPIATPIALAGFTPAAVRYLEPWLAERGFVASLGGAKEPGGSCDSLLPGSAIGVELVRGDWSAAAIGTVTYRDKDRILAFGHPFMSMGWVDFPITAATIHTIMVSSQISNKVASPTATCGALVADREAGIAGTVGPTPAMVPVSVSIEGTGGRARRYRFEIARSRYLTPGLLSAVVVSSISDELFEAGVSTIRYDVAYSMNGGKRTIHQGDLFLTTSPVSGVGEAVSQALTVLLGDRFRPSRLDSASVRVSAAEGIDEAAVVGIRVTPPTAAPGDSVDAEVTLRRPAKPLETRHVRIRIPPSTPDGDVTIRVCDGGETEKWEMGRVPDRYKPQTFDQLADIIETTRRSDRLYVQVYREAGGAVVDGGEISQAPRSVLSVIGASMKSGDASETKGATLAEVSIPMGRVVRGCESATVSVVSDPRR
ncbi:MAG TPA: SpoIVB peptidase S55 domain-containing protein [Candidatus Eisenbacteria bacterium]